MVTGLQGRGVDDGGGVQQLNTNNCFSATRANKKRAQKFVGGSRRLDGHPDDEGDDDSDMGEEDKNIQVSTTPQCTTPTLTHNAQEDNGYSEDELDVAQANEMPTEYDKEFIDNDDADDSDDDNSEESYVPSSEEEEEGDAEDSDEMQEDEQVCICFVCITRTDLECCVA